MPLGAAFLRIITVLVLGIPLFLSFAYFLGATAVRDTLLRSDYLSRQFDENQVYDRIYSEILMDPEFDEWTDRLVGNLELSQEEKVELLRQVIPPEYIKVETERGVNSLVSYINNENDDLSLYIDLAPAIQRVEPAVYAYVDRRIDAMASVPVSGPDALAREFEAFVSSMADGQVPSQAPSLEGTGPLDWSQSYMAAARTTTEGAASTGDAIGRLQMQEPAIVAAINSGDMRGALKLASRTVLQPRVQGAVSELQANLDQQARLDLVEHVARDSSRTRSQVIRDANIARFVVQHGTGDAARRAALGLMALCAVAIGLVFVPHWRHVIFWPSATLLVTGLLLLGLWWGIVLEIPSLLFGVCEDPQGSSCQLSLDLARSIAAGIGSDFTGPALLVVTIGLGGILLSMLVGMASGLFTPSRARRA